VDRRDSNNKSSGGRSVDDEIIKSHLVTGSTTTLVSSDLRSRPQNFNIVQRPPRNLFTQTYWTTLSNVVQVTSSVSAITEYNISFAANSFTGSAGYLATFDQYCIYMLIVNFAYLQENSAVTSSVQNVRIHTALDYDNAANIGLNPLMSFSSYSASELGPNTSLVRSVKPCVSDTLYGSGTTTGSGLRRTWIDSAFPTIVHYGVRSILGQTVVSTVTIDIGLTAIFGFRNGI
jgi:hypothetical protein